MSSAPDQSHIAFNDPEAVFDEIGRLGWALGVKAEIIERFALLRHREGAALAAKDARDCLIRLLGFLKSLTDQPQKDRC